MSSTPSFLTAEEWIDLSMETDSSQVVFGSTGQAIVRPQTKNLIQAPEKAFKTTFMLRTMLGLSAGVTVFPQLSVIKPRRVLYVHGELSPPEIQERTRAAAIALPRPLNNFYQGRDIAIHLGKRAGQNALADLVKEYKPEDLVIDPWQAFIPGFDENEFRDVSRATHFMDQLIEEFGVTIYLVTHMGKDHSRGTRGHSSLAGWRNTLFTLERKKDKEIVEVKIEPRWAAPVKPFNLKFKEGTVWPTEESGFTGQANKIRAFVLGQGGKSTRQALQEHLELGDDTLRKALSRAEEQKAIVVVGDEVRLPEDHERIVKEFGDVFG
jgi:hypothetical protein